MIEVLIVDDRPALRAGLVQLLAASDDLRVVACAPGGHEGVRLAVAHDPDVVLMGLEMPDLDGAAATRAILAADSTAKVVVLSALGDRALIVEALDAGAIGYLLKDANPEELVRAVKAAANGEALAGQRERPSDRER